MFAVYTYLASTLLEVTHASPASIPVMLAVFGAGLTIGNLVCAWAADRGVMQAAGATLVWSAVALALYPFATGSLWTLMPVRVPDRLQRWARHRAADAPDGCRRGRADARGRAQSLRLQHRQRARSVARRHCHWRPGLASPRPAGSASCWRSAASSSGRCRWRRIGRNASSSGPRKDFRARRDVSPLHRQDENRLYSRHRLRSAAVGNMRLA